MVLMTEYQPLGPVATVINDAGLSALSPVIMSVLTIFIILQIAVAIFWRMKSTKAIVSGAQNVRVTTLATLFVVFSLFLLFSLAIGYDYARIGSAAWSLTTIQKHLGLKFVVAFVFISLLWWFFEYMQKLWNDMKKPWFNPTGEKQTGELVLYYSYVVSASLLALPVIFLILRAFGIPTIKLKRS